MSETFTRSNPIETEKIRTHHAKIVVECTNGKPYYSIEWFDTAKQECCLGYSSYFIDNVLGWLKEYFEIVEAPKTNADRIRAMRDYMGTVAQRRLIDANALIEEYDRVHIGEPGKARKLMEDAPTVDAVEVVRCKDCIGKSTWFKDAENGCEVCGMSGMYPKGEFDFCSYGDRRKP